MTPKLHTILPRGPLTTQLRALQDGTRSLRAIRAPGILTRSSSRGIVRRAYVRRTQLSDAGEARWA